jgi:hypothetical protein
VCAPLAEPVTVTEAMWAGETPRTLIWVRGEASGVPASGEIASGAADAADTIVATAVAVRPASSRSVRATDMASD